MGRYPARRGKGRRGDAHAGRGVDDRDGIALSLRDGRVFQDAIAVDVGVGGMRIGGRRLDLMLERRGLW